MSFTRNQSKQRIISSSRRLLIGLAAIAALATACSSPELPGDAVIGPVGSQDPTPSPIDDTPAAAQPVPTPEPSGATSAQPDATPVPIVEAATEADPTLTVIEVSQGGAFAQYKEARITIGAIQATTAKPLSLIAEKPELDSGGRSYLVVPITAQAMVIPGSWLVIDDYLTLHAPDGSVLEAQGLYDRSGSSSSINLKGRNTLDRWVVFATDDLVNDVSGWDLVLSSDGELPLPLPLVGPAYADPYPISLATGADGVFTTGSITSCKDGSTYNTVVERAEVAVQDVDVWDYRVNIRNTSVRTKPGDRFVRIDLTYTGTESDLDISCGFTSSWPDMLLDVDGFQFTPERSDLPNIRSTESLLGRLVYRIPRDSQQIRLFGSHDGLELGSWDLPQVAALGEDGAERARATSQIAPQPAPAGERPGELVVEQITNGGASGLMLGGEVTVGSVTATNAEPTSFVNNNPELDGDDNTWVVADLDVTGQELADWRLWDYQFVLESPAGRTSAGVHLFDQVGEEIEPTVRLEGTQRILVRVAFETDGLVADPAGWVLHIDNGDNIALSLPLVGDARSDLPFALEAGQTTKLVLDYWPCRSDPVLDVDLVALRVDLEGPESIVGEGRQIFRADANQLAVIIRVGFEDPNGSTEPLKTCLDTYRLPHMVLDADGRPTISRPHGEPSADANGRTEIDLTYIVADDTETITLFDSQGDAIGIWQLKDTGEVLANFEAKEVDDRTLITLDETVLFAFGESTLQQGAGAPLTRVARLITDESSGEVDIVGHTDSIGDETDNQALSLARAQAVADALVDRGVDPDRLVVSGRGESAPIAPNETAEGADDPEGRAQNRRVEVFFAIG